jgi:hypothetical protein
MMCNNNDLGSHLQQCISTMTSVPTIVQHWVPTMILQQTNSQADMDRPIQCSSLMLEGEECLIMVVVAAVVVVVVTIIRITITTIIMTTAIII